jgi:hypothetical protein
MDPTVAVSMGVGAGAAAGAGVDAGWDSDVDSFLLHAASRRTPARASRRRLANRVFFIMITFL